jgi:hypothetical protein
VSHAGVALIRALSHNIGLTAGLSRALATDRLLVHDRGRVLADLACAIADGAGVISDFRVMGDQEDLFGLVASVPTAWRTLDEIARGGDRTLGRVTAAVNAARRRAWAGIAARHGALPSWAAGPPPCACSPAASGPTGAQLTLFEAEDGWRYTLSATNLPASTRGWRGQYACIDAAHRVHARVEDAIRTGKDCGIGKYSSTSLAMNKAWQTAALIAATLLAWLRLLALDGHLAKAEPKTLRPHPARRRPADPRRPPAPPQHPGHLALGGRHPDRLGSHQRPAACPLTSTKPVPAIKEGATPPGPAEPRPPGPAGVSSSAEPEIPANQRTARPARPRPAPA